MKTYSGVVKEQCHECPFFEFEVNRSCSNSDGSAKCGKCGGYIGNFRGVEIPDWCPLPNAEEPANASLKKFHVFVTDRKVTRYEIEAENSEEAQRKWEESGNANLDFPHMTQADDCELFINNIEEVT